MSVTLDKPTTTIRPASRAKDFDALWDIFHHVIQGVDTYAFDPETSPEGFEAFWFAPNANSYVFVETDAQGNEQVLGGYLLRPMFTGPGSHVANGAYMVHPQARGKGVGRKLGEHSLIQARQLGYKALQYMAVVSTNTAAVKLWQSIGFQIIGTVPGGFKHGTLGYVDLYIMYQALPNAV